MGCLHRPRPRIPHCWRHHRPRPHLDQRRWTAHPGESRDPNLRHLFPGEYLPYALNTYRVLLTRGTHATYIHATDPGTHRMVNRLIRPR
ncbi:DNA/RNA helicase domain-containing protein [Streptomyces sp. NPDC052020]|uniref:DNA/RNA helicase domain-containing protein n=1 Tax=Streptomyces sp. NPDC052020 TaxID=3155677 RepID=UPI003449C4D0